MLKKILKKILKLFIIFFLGTIKSVFLFLSFTCFFIINFFFAYYFLTAKGLVGNDIYNVFSHISWLSHYFPKIPFWYPVEGTGTSLQYGYPILAHLITIFISRLTGFSLIETFRWLGFLSSFLIAGGIFFYCWLRLKSQLTGFLAGLFYLVSPVAYTWLFNFGFYAESIGLIFMPWALLGFEFFLENYQKGKWRKTFFWLLFSIVFWGLAILCHYIIGIGLVTLFFLLSLGSFFKKIKINKGRVKRGMEAFSLFCLFAFSLWGFRLLPSVRLLVIANREGLNTDVSFEQVDYYSPQLKTILGTDVPELEIDKDADYILRDYHFALPVTLLFIFGSLVCLIAPGLRVFVFLSWLNLLIFSSPKLTYFLMHNLPFGSFYFLNRRALFSVSRLMIPVVAVVGIWKLIAGIHELLVRFFVGKRKNGWPEKVISGAVVIPLLLGLLMFLFYFARKLPGDPSWVFRYGWNRFGETGAFDLRDIWRKRRDDICVPGAEKGGLAEKLCGFEEVEEKFNIIELVTLCVGEKHTTTEWPDFCQEEKINKETVKQLLNWCGQNPDSVYCQAQYESLEAQLQKNWPGLEARDEITFFSEENLSLLRSLKEKGIERYDVSPQLGNFITASTLYSDVSRFGLYTHQLSLNHAMWGYLQGLYYSDNQINRSSGVVEELARWFGIKAVILRTADYLENFDESFWDKYFDYKKLAVLEAKESLVLSSLSSRPVLLAVGDIKKDSFNTVFKLGNRGVFAYDNFWLVEGESKYIDNYNLKELKNFDGLILHAYAYKNRGKGWRLLNQYVKAGGRVFVNAGWQYEVPDWEIKEGPDFLPVKKTKWTDYGKEGKYKVNEEFLGGKIEEEKFSPLIWGGDPWGVSGVAENDLKDWAKTILEFEGKPLLVAGEYGEGKVVWSGVNLFSHALENKNEEEIKFLGVVFNWLVDNKEKKEGKFEIKRDNPDKVVFNFEEDFGQGWLLWKEAYYPDWRAKLYQNGKGEKIKIYRGGPGLMMVPLKGIKPDDRLELYYQEPFWFKILKGLSVASIFSLLALIIKPDLRKVNLGRGKILHNLRKKWNSEEY